MTAAELARLLITLEARQAELEKRICNRDEIAINLSADMLDQIQRVSERDMAVGDLERESVRLREVGAALLRIRQGKFGICADCEEEISQKRLAALPWTASCLACSEAAGRRHVLAPNTIESSLLTEP